MRERVSESKCERERKKKKKKQCKEVLFFSSVLLALLVASISSDSKLSVLICLYVVSLSVQVPIVWSSCLAQI